MDRQTNGQINKQAGRQMDGQTYEETKRWTETDR